MLFLRMVGEYGPRFQKYDINKIENSAKHKLPNKQTFFLAQIKGNITVQFTEYLTTGVVTGTT